MELAEAAWDPRPAIAADRAALLDLLDDLDPADWERPTDAGHWTVKDVALHMLDDDLGLLARDRDDDRSGWLEPPGGLRGLVEALDAKNDAWVLAARGLSPRLIVELLSWTGDRLDEHLGTAGLDGTGSVAWASDAPVPRWFDVARELTERWSHQQHIRDAVDRPDEHDDLLPMVLGTFVWAYPHQLPPSVADGTSIDIDLRPAGRWHLRSRSGRWVLQAGPSTSAPTGTLTAEPLAAWRLLTGLPVTDGAVAATGPRTLVEPLLAVRGILV